MIRQSPPKEQRRILVVDDNPSDTQLVKRCLERTNEYIVREENDARSALATAESFHPDLILLDVMMPGLGGGELASAFRESTVLRDVPIVFLTSIITRREVEARGGITVPYLAKPIVLEEVLASVKHHLHT